MSPLLFETQLQASNRPLVIYRRSEACNGWALVPSVCNGSAGTGIKGRICCETAQN